MDLFQIGWCLFMGWILNDLYKTIRIAYLNHKLAIMHDRLYSRIKHHSDVLNKEHLKVVERD